MLLSCCGIPLGETAALSQETPNPNFLLLFRRRAWKETVRRELGQAIYSESVCDLKISMKKYHGDKALDIPHMLPRLRALIIPPPCDPTPSVTTLKQANHSPVLALGAISLPD